MRKALIAITLLCSLSATADAPRVITVPFELVRRHIMLPVLAGNGTRLTFMFDTGDRYAIIDRERARELNLQLGGQVHVQGSSAMLMGAFVKNATYRIVGVDGFEQPIVLTIPLASLEKRLGAKFDGILGADFIRQYVVEVDYAARALRLHDRNTFDYRGDGQVIPLRFNSSGHPIFDGEVTPVGGAPIRGELVLDLGSSSQLTIRTPVVQRYKLTSGATKTLPLIGGAGAGGDSKGRIGRVASVRIGRFTLNRPLAVFSEDTQGDHAVSETLGSVGQELMARFRIFLDYSRNRMILEPVKSFDAPFDRAFNGVIVDAMGDDFRTFRIRDVTPGSAAERSGAKSGDLVDSLDGTPASKLTLTQITEILERVGKHRMRVRRGQETVDLTLDQQAEI
jgi:hypothetical protein